MDNFELWYRTKLAKEQRNVLPVSVIQDTVINSVTWKAENGVVTGDGVTAAPAKADALALYGNTIKRNGNYWEYLLIREDSSYTLPEGVYRFSVDTVEPIGYAAIMLIVGTPGATVRQGGARQILSGGTFTVASGELVEVVISVRTSNSHYEFRNLKVTAVQMDDRLKRYFYHRYIVSRGR